mgnify:FL=1
MDLNSLSFPLLGQEALYTAQQVQPGARGLQAAGQDLTSPHQGCQASSGLDPVFLCIVHCPHAILAVILN